MRSVQKKLLVLLGALAQAAAGCSTETAPASDAGADAATSDGGGALDTGALADAAPIDAAPDPDAGPTDGGTVSLTLAFEHLVDGAPVVLGTDTPYTNAAGNHFGVTRVSYFVSDVTVTTTTGATYEVPGAHYVDHETTETRELVLSIGAATGELASISFVMGLPPALNVTGAFSSPPESLMEWPVPMGGGYHYLKFEGRYVDSASAPFNFRVHSGGLMGVDYSFPVELDASGTTIGGGDVTVTIAMNLEEWFTGPNDWDLNDYFNAATPGIMGNATAQASLRENGAGVFSLVAP